MDNDRDQTQNGNSERAHEQETRIVRRGRRLEPDPPEVYGERQLEPTYEEPYAAPGSVVEERSTGRRVVRSPGDTMSRFARLIYFIFGVIETLIAIRAVLRVLGARQENGFASLIYGLTQPFVSPFLGIFGREPGFGNSVLEFGSLLAIVVYALIAYMLVRLLYLFSD